MDKGKKRFKRYRRSYVFESGRIFLCAKSEEGLRGSSPSLCMSNNLRIIWRAVYGSKPLLLVEFIYGFYIFAEDAYIDKVIGEFIFLFYLHELCLLQFLDMLRDCRLGKMCIRDRSMTMLLIS